MFSAKKTFKQPILNVYQFIFFLKTASIDTSRLLINNYLLPLSKFSDQSEPIQHYYISFTCFWLNVSLFSGGGRCRSGCNSRIPEPVFTKGLKQRFKTRFSELSIFDSVFRCYSPTQRLCISRMDQGFCACVVGNILVVTNLK